jgi:Fic/DOC family
MNRGADAATAQGVARTPAGTLHASAPLLNARALAFLHESNAIEDIHGFDYSQNRSDTPQGHAAAFLHSQRLAQARKTVSALDLCYWQQLIVLEQRQAHIDVPERAVGHFRSAFAPFNVGVGAHVPPSFAHVPALMQVWLGELRAHLLDDATGTNPGNHQAPKPAPTSSQLADLCGETLQRFQAIHPFVDGNGRVGRLLVNYLLAYWQRPIVVFTLAERDLFFAAHRSRANMRQFMGHKLAV